MVNEQEFFKRLEEMKRSNKDFEKLKQYESIIRSAVIKKYPISHIQKALKEVYKVKVSEYILKKFIQSLDLKKPETKTEPKPQQPQQPQRVFSNPSAPSAFGQKVNSGGQ